MNKFNYLSLFFLIFMFSCQVTGNKEMLYIGTFSNNDNSGIYVAEFDRDAQSMLVIDTVTTPQNPSFLSIASDGNYLYSVNRESVSDDPEHGSISAFQISNSGLLLSLNQVSTGDAGPCYVSSDNQGNWLFTAHYNGGSWGAHQLLSQGVVSKLVALYEHKGSSIDSARQQAPHAHMISTDPDNEYIVVSDLGLDQVKIHSIQPTFDSINVIQTTPGSGPRHFAFHPELDIIYVAEELSSTVSVWPFTPQYPISQLQRLSTLPAEFDAKNSVADMHLSPDGKFLYVSNRGHNSLAIYAVGEDGILTLVGHQSTMGERPRNFCIDPQGDFIWVANRDSNEVVLFVRDKNTGLLEFTGQKISVPEAVCIKYLTL